MMGFGLIIIIVVVGVGIYLFNGSKDNLSSIFSNKQDRSAREILEERYARGEIEKDEFDQKMKDIT